MAAVTNALAHMCRSSTARTDVVRAAEELILEGRAVWACHDAPRYCWPESQLRTAFVTDYVRGEVLPSLKDDPAFSPKANNIPIHFVRWLREKREGPHANRLFRSSLPVVMNCMDFVYLAYYRANLIAKRELFRRYKQEVSRDKPEQYYGLELRKKKIVDGAKAGDVIIAFVDQDPLHVCLSLGADRVASLWYAKPTGVSVHDLWMEPYHHPAEFPLSHFVGCCDSLLPTYIEVSRISMKDVLS